MRLPTKRLAGLIVLIVPLFLFSTAAQETRKGPIKPPATTADPSKKETASDQRPVNRQTSEGTLDPSPPPIPVEDIIQKFAAKEAEFREARSNYTYTQSVRVRDFDTYGNPGGEYRRESDIVFSSEGRRYERVSYEPPSSLVGISMTREDFRDIENLQPFVLTTAEVPKYNVTYKGRQNIDELSTYVFEVSPKRIEPNQRYFEGTIWVEANDLQIVKTLGKAVPDLKTKAGENLFPKFETFREQIDGKFWFPTYTRADDVLHFKTNDVRIRTTIRYSNYRQFRSTTRILPPSSSPQTTSPPEKKPPLD